MMDLIYPRRCPICDGITTQGLVHKQCRESVTEVEEPMCFSCGKPLLSEEVELCRDCVEHPKHFRRGYAVFVYNDVTRPAMMAYKYANRREYTEFFVNAMMDKYGRLWEKQEYDGIISVPIHRKRRAKRGYNQAELLARALGKTLEVPVYTKLICRTINTIPLKKLSNKERLKHLKRAFQPGYSYLRKHVQECKGLKKVLLVDDIYTTGATMDACTEVLHRLGVVDVDVVSVCIGQGQA